MKEKIFMAKNSGFTLIELLVSIGILLMIMSVVLWGYGSFNDRLALSSATEEIVLAIRQAQAYGIDSRENKSGGGNFTAPYGIYFDVTDDTTQRSYYIFIDLNRNNKFDLDPTCSAVGTECIEKFSIPNGVKIYHLYARGSLWCTTISKMHITFTRPNPDARIILEQEWNPFPPACSPANEGGIMLLSPKNLQNRIILNKTGYTDIVTF